MTCRFSEKWERETEVLIVGTGFAGLAAAIEAYDAGASVIILEKESTSGGNSIIAGGGVNAVDPQRQIPQRIKDSVDLHFRQTFEGGNCLGDPEKIRFMVENASKMCINWLEDIGIVWPEEVIQGFGALWQRTHFPAKYGKYRKGAAIICAELDQVSKREIPVLLKHKVVKIVREKPLEGKVLGVEIETEGKRLYFKAKKAVILASGGFAANLGMVVSHDRRLANTPTSNHIGATGECIVMAQDIGAEVVGMGYVQCVPRIVKSPSLGYFLVISSKDMDSLTNPYKIFVNKEGIRFVSEDGRRDEITFAALTQQPFKPLPRVKGETIEELEKKLGMQERNLVNTVEKYNCYCDARNDPDFDKRPPLLIQCRTPPFTAETVAPARHHTMGGLKVEGTTGRVIDRWEKIIPHLYAAGEATGGFHGANRLGHNATPECVVFGRVIGKDAAKSSHRN
jgi:succinate dehydrogenase/fumarate reductase flavoprotein subunit